MSRVVKITGKNGVTLQTKDKIIDDDIAIQVDGAENITANNIKSGVTILGVAGTLPAAPSGTLSITENGTYDVSGYENVTVEIGGSNVSLYRHVIQITSPLRGSFIIENDNSTPLTFSSIINFLVSNGFTTYSKLYPFTGVSGNTANNRWYGVGLYTVSGSSTIWTINTSGGNTVDITTISEDIITRVL